MVRDPLLACFLIQRKRELLPPNPTMDDRHVPVAVNFDCGWIGRSFGLRPLDCCKVSMEDLICFRFQMEEVWRKLSWDGWWNVVGNILPIGDEEYGGPYDESYEDDPEEYKNSGYTAEIASMREKTELMLEEYDRIEKEGDLYLWIFHADCYTHRDKPWFMDPRIIETEEERSKHKRYMEAVLAVQYESSLYKYGSIPSEEWYRKGCWRKLIER